MKTKYLAMLFIGLFISITISGCSSAEENITWKNCNVIEMPKYNCIAYGNDTYVAVGNGGAISTSANAKDWNAVPIKITNGLKYIVWNGEEFKAVGDKGAVLTSTDGEEWVFNRANITSDFSFIMYAQKKYIAITDNQHEIVVSEDGQTWTSCSLDNQFAFEKIVYNEQYYIAIGGDVLSSKSYVYLSKDGINWNRHHVGEYGKFTDIIIDKGIAIASVGDIGAGENYQILSSKDCLNWKADTKNSMLISCLCKTKDGYVYSAYNDLYVSKDLATWTKLKISAEDEYISKFIACNGEVFAFPYYSNNVYYSEGGSVWEYSIKAHYISFQDVVWYDNKFIAVSYDELPKPEATLFVSEDGSKWIWSTVKSSLSINFEDTSLKDDSIATNGTSYIKVNVDGLFYSDYSTNQRKINLDEKNLLFLGVVWGGNRYLAYGSESDGEEGIIYFSLDGITWTKMITNTNNQITGIAWNGEKYVAVGYNGTILTYIPEK